MRADAGAIVLPNVRGMTGAERVHELLADETVLDIRRHRDLRTAVWRLKRAGAVVEILPRHYVAAERASDDSVRLLALTRWAPQAVLIAASARTITEGGVPAAPFHVALPSTRAVPTWIRRVRRRLPPHAITATGGVRHVTVAYLAVEAAGSDQGERIFAALRTKAVVPAELVAVLSAFRGCPGVARRRPVVRRSVRKPWSVAEDRLHALFDEADIGGWIANHAFRRGGVRVVADAYFPDAGLVVEFDSWEFHSDREAFERDRHKQNLLSALGLRVVRITWTMLTTDPAGVVRAIRDALAVAPAQAC